MRIVKYIMARRIRWDMGVTEPERLSNSTLRHTFKKRNSALIAVLPVTVGSSIISTSHTLKLVWNGPFSAVEQYSLFLSLTLWQVCHFDVIWCIVLFLICGVINQKTTYGWSSFINGLITAPDTKVRGYK